MPTRSSAGSALVSGASSGIGRAVALMLARDGMHLLITGRNATRLGSTGSLVKQYSGHDPVMVVADLSTDAGQNTLIAAAVSRRPPLECVVNNAGESVPMGDGLPDRWDEVIATQFSAVRKVTEACLPILKGSGRGRVINIGGTLEPPNKVNGSTVAKAAVVAWAKSLSREVGPHGVTVNTLIPGRILTPQIVERLHPDEAERADFARAHIPLGYFGDPDDVAHLVRFLASEAARYITGEVIHVDGGLRRHAF